MVGDIRLRLRPLIVLFFAAFMADAANNGTSANVDTLTTSSGMPVGYKQIHSLNSNLIYKEFYIDSMTNLVRERIPERMWHANGAGAFGYFEVTNNITNICKANLFSADRKKTPVVARFSTVINGHGGTDNIRDRRGFAVKFYTEEGNFDIVGLNTPMFVIKDPASFPSFIHAQKLNPVSHLPDSNMFWDFLTLHPETIHLFLIVFGDRGIPDGYRHMPGYGIHTFQVVNDYGEISFIRFNFSPEAGIKNLFCDEARTITGKDPDYAKRDLFNAISEGKFPSWKVGIQILSIEDVKAAKFDVFDITKVLPLDKYPVTPLGRLVLNRNPTNYFADVEQLSFSPAHLVPGILGAPDKMFQARLLAYRDAQFYRLGPKYNDIPVNCPIHAINSYTLHGIAKNGRGKPNYYPNSFNGPEPYNDTNEVEMILIHEDKPNNFDQAAELYNEMTEDERRRLTQNILESLKNAEIFLQERAVELFKTVHSDLGLRVEKGLGTV